MRLLHVNHRYAPFVGGSERFMQEVSEHRARRGDHVDLVTTDAFDLEFLWDARGRRVDAPACQTLNGVHVMRVPIEHPPLSSLVFQGGRRALGELSRFVRSPGPFEAAASVLPRIPQLRKALESAGPVDLVHATNVSIESLALAAFRHARRVGARFALTPFIHLGVDGDPVARRYVSMPHQVRLLREADVVLTMTQREADFVCTLGVPRDRAVVTGAGVEPGEVCGGDAARFRESVGVRGRLIGTLGALAADKGTPDLVRAVGVLRSRGCDVDLALAGPALRGFTRWFYALSEREREGIHILGVVTHETRRDMLAALDVLVMPSRTESFGIAYLEGWVNRKPVIAADAGAVSEIVHDGLNGRLVRFGNVPELVEAINQLLDDSEWSRRLGLAGYDMVMSRFTWDHVMTRVDSAYAVAMAGNHRGDDQ